MKTNIRKRNVYVVGATDKASRNHQIQSTIPERANSKMEAERRKQAIIASWFKPPKSKGFKLKTK